MAYSSNATDENPTISPQGRVSTKPGLESDNGVNRDGLPACQRSRPVVPSSKWYPLVVHWPRYDLSQGKPRNMIENHALPKRNGSEIRIIAAEGSSCG